MLIQDGRPVAYASRTMTSAQQNYAIIEKELQAVVFACERFHQFIYGTHVLVFSDHKPLESISKKLLAQAPPRLQRMLLRLQKYVISITYRPGTEMNMGDALFRAHLSDVWEEIPEEELNAQMHRISQTWDDDLQDMKCIKTATKDDETLQEIIRYIQDGWPIKQCMTDAAKRFFSYRDELSVIRGVVFKGERVIISETLKSKIRRKLHQSHMGMEKTKLRARTSIFRPGINRDVKGVGKSCNECLSTHPHQQKESLISSEIPTYPWQIVGTDL